MWKSLTSWKFWMIDTANWRGRQRTYNEGPFRWSQMFEKYPIFVDWIILVLCSIWHNFTEMSNCCIIWRSNALRLSLVLRRRDRKSKELKWSVLMKSGGWPIGRGSNMFKSPNIWGGVPSCKSSGGGSVAGLLADQMSEVGQGRARVWMAGDCEN